MERKGSDAKSTPMDPGAQEGDLASAAVVHHTRECWAMKTLVEEVRDLFPETTYETSGYNGRGTALDVTFDLTTLDADLRPLVANLLVLIQSDIRVDDVSTEEDRVLVCFLSSPRVQDSRESFNLAEAWLILTGEDQ